MLQRKMDTGYSGLRKRTLVRRREMLAGLGAALLLSISRVMPAKALMPADAITGTDPLTLAAAPREQPVFVQKGKASWYGPGFGRRRAGIGSTTAR
jgi:rare lipoprotein A (peptidoglycan hydrolase)